MKKRKETKEERQRRIQEGLDSVFDEPFGKKREKTDKKRNTRMKKELDERSGDTDRSEPAKTRQSEH